MAKEDFKNKVTKAQEDLFKALESEKTKRNNVITKITNELSKQKKANVKILNSLNKEYLTLCQNNVNELQTFIDKINSLNEDLQKGINKFNESYKIEDEKQKLLDEKDKVLQPLKQKAKREGHDINTKMERIDKELQDTLEDRSNNFSEGEKTYKNKLLEYEKRRRIELARIQANIVKECDEYQKKLILENKRSEINKIKKAIKDIRYQGLLTEKECLLKYCDEIEQYELNYINEVYNYNLENITLTKDYKTRYFGVKKDKLLTEKKYDDEFNIYEIEVDNSLAINNRSMLEKQNGIKGVYYNKISKATINKLDKDQKINQSEQEYIESSINNAFELDLKQIAKLNDLNYSNLKSMENEIKLYEKNLIFTINFYLQNILVTYDAYFKDLFLKEENLLSLFIINDFNNNEIFNGFNFEEYINALLNCYNTFKVTEDEVTNKFKNRITNACNTLITQVNEFTNNILLINEDINLEVVNYSKLLETILGNAKENSLNHIKSLMNQKQEVINENMNSNNSSLEANKMALEKELVVISEDYNSRINEVNRLKEVENKRYEEIVNSVNLEIDSQIKEINDNYDKSLNEFNEEKIEKENNIKTKFNTERQNIEKTYKTKIGLL